MKPELKSVASGLKLSCRKELATGVSPDLWAVVLVAGRMQGFSTQGRSNLCKSSGSRQTSNKSSCSLGMGISSGARSGCKAQDMSIFSKTETDKIWRQV